MPRLVRIPCLQKTDLEMNSPWRVVQFDLGLPVLGLAGVVIVSVNNDPVRNLQSATTHHFKVANRMPFRSQNERASATRTGTGSW